LPYRAGKKRKADVEIMLVTSRETKRWVIPKGNFDFKGSPHAAAAREADEEGGVRGKVSQKPIGRFRYEKRIESGRSVVAKVTVFPLAVTEELVAWKEQGERKRRWFSRAEAAKAVDEADLSKMIGSFKPKRFE